MTVGVRGDKGERDEGNSGLWEEYQDGDIL